MSQPEIERWAVILAGGSGARLQSFTQRLYGEARPKQFCTLFGDDTLLGNTRARIASVIPPSETAYVVVRAHAPYYKEHLGGVPTHRIFTQPADFGTTAAVAYSAARIAAIRPNAVAGFFPADHHVEDEAAFAQTLQEAYRLAALSDDTVLLLGAQAEHADVEYGWIEPGDPLMPEQLGARAPLFRVRRFWEKPSAEIARGLLHRGCMWNTFVMVGRVRSFLAILRASVPAVYHAFEPLLEIETFEPAALTRVFGNVTPGDFSQQVLSALPDRLAVLRLDNVGWSDLGTPERLKAAWARLGTKPLTAA